MKRRLVDCKDIKRNVVEDLREDYDPVVIKTIVEATLRKICESFKKGDVVDVGIGKSYIKLRKNNQGFSPRKPYSIVYRGDIYDEVSSQIIDECLSNEELFDMFYTRRGVKDQSED